MGSKKAKALAVSNMGDGDTNPDVRPGGSSSGTKQLSEKEKALARIEWLKALAGQLLQEARELEAKWGSADSGDAMELDVPADTADAAPGATDAAGDEPDEPAQPSKNKKARKNKKKDAGVDTTDAEAPQPQTPSVSGQTTEGRDGEKPEVVKSKKDKKRKRQDPGEGAPAEVRNNTTLVESSGVAQHTVPEQPQEKDSKKAKKESKKAKESKKTKKANKEKDNKAARDTDSAGAEGKDHVSSSASVADKWNVGALGGGPERQSKFMKLLGGGKAAPSPATQNSDKVRPTYDVQKSQEDLQRQYEAGMRMKFDGQGQRRGLGA